MSKKSKETTQSICGCGMLERERLARNQELSTEKPKSNLAAEEKPFTLSPPAWLVQETGDKPCKKNSWFVKAWSYLRSKATRP